MQLDPAAQRELIRAVAERVIRHTDELVSLDQAIGDGDHGINLKRGFEAVLADIDRLGSLPLGDALFEGAMVLVRTIGGASGPLYGTLFMTLGRQLPAQASRQDLVRAFAAAVDAVKRRGKSDAGQKTMLDVLIPVLDVLSSANGADVCLKLRTTAREAAQATVPMQATRGRASFLGARSIGHMDPGARSSELIIEAVTEFVGDKL
jgi:phosphoenolpyruvate---glycerone phosphotransferase subunit DhaL